MKSVLLIVASFFTSLATFAASLESPFSNIDQISSSLKISSILRSNSERNLVRIAILDNGFRNFELEVGKSIPTATSFHAGPIAVPETQLDSHGTAMAQIIAGVLDKAAGSDFKYELHLYSAFGYSNFSAAVNDAISRKMDIILYSQVWEYGGFGNGQGFINAVVNRATSNGILWINAAGNFGKGTYQTRVTADSEGWAQLPAQNSSVRIRCEQNSTSKCHARLVLSWNDFNNDVNVGTEKDLDLSLFNESLQTIKTAALQQKKDFPEGQPGLSKYPREIMEVELTPGTYLAKVKIRSNNFGANDQLRLTVSGENVTLVDRTKELDPLNPADNRSIITVGAADSEMSSTGNGKPEVKVNSFVQLNSGESFKGSSNSAAMFAAVAAAFKSGDLKMNRATLLRAWARLNGDQEPAPQPTPAPQPQPTPAPTPEPQPVPTPEPQPIPEPLPEPTPHQPNNGPLAQPGRGLPLHLLQFQPTGPGCFTRSRTKDAPPQLRQLLLDGAIPVDTTVGVKVIVLVEPLTIIHGIQRSKLTDMVVARDDGFWIYPREYQTRLPKRAYEVIELPEGQYICAPDGSHPQAHN